MYWVYPYSHRSSLNDFFSFFFAQAKWFLKQIHPGLLRSTYLSELSFYTSSSTASKFFSFFFFFFFLISAGFHLILNLKFLPHQLPFFPCWSFWRKPDCSKSSNSAKKSRRISSVHRMLPQWITVSDLHLSRQSHKTKALFWNQKLLSYLKS